MFNKNYVAIACIDWLDDNVESISNTLQTVSHDELAEKILISMVPPENSKDSYEKMFREMVINMDDVRIGFLELIKEELNMIKTEFEKRK